MERISTLLRCDEQAGRQAALLMTDRDDHCRAKPLPFFFTYWYVREAGSDTAPEGRLGFNLRPVINLKTISVRWKEISFCCRYFMPLSSTLLPFLSPRSPRLLSSYDTASFS